MKIKTCEICGVSYTASSPNRKYCDNCRSGNVERAKINAERALVKSRLRVGDNLKIKERTCLVCKKTFYSEYNRPFCSLECANVNRIKHSPCPNCGGQITGSTLTTFSSMYCSEKCRIEFTIKRAKEKGNYIRCEGCGNYFVRKNPKTRFCSMNCRTVKIRNDKIKQGIANRPPYITNETRKCGYCGAPFTWKSSQPNKQFCSPACQRNNAKAKRVNALKEQDVSLPVHLCSICKPNPASCERFTAGHNSFPKGTKIKMVKGRQFVVKCDKFKAC